MPKQRKTRQASLPAQIEQLVSAAGQLAVFHAAKSCTIVFLRTPYRLYVRVSGYRPGEKETRYIEVRFLVEDGEYLPAELDDVIRYTAAGEPIDIAAQRGGIVLSAAAGEQEIRQRMSDYAALLQREAYEKWAALEYDLQVVNWEADDRIGKSSEVTQARSASEERVVVLERSAQHEDQPRRVG